MTFTDCSLGDSKFMLSSTEIWGQIFYYIYLVMSFEQSPLSNICICIQHVVISVIDSHPISANVTNIVTFDIGFKGNNKSGKLTAGFNWLHSLLENICKGKVVSCGLPRILGEVYIIFSDFSITTAVKSKCYLNKEDCLN